MATFHLDLVAPDKVTFSGEVEQVDVPGIEGDFGVLADHAPMVALLRPGVLRVVTGAGEQQIVVFGGFAEFSNNTLTILADVAVPADAFDRAALIGHIERLEESIKAMEAGSQLDREIQKLDHFKAVQTHLQTTAMH
jgi:F-type H+-transporting ATPase subunit epsilon